MKHVMWMAALVLVACQPAQEQAQIASNTLDAQVEQAAPANIQFGMDFDAFNIDRHEVAPNEYFGGILSGYGLGAANIQAIVDRAQGIFDPRQLRAGRLMHLLFDPADGALACLIYEKTDRAYVLFDLREEGAVSAHDHPVELREEAASGTITSSLYNALEDDGASPELSMTMANIYAWTVDFYRVQKGDGFKVIYDEEWVRDKRVGSGGIRACWFKHRGEWIEAYAWEKDGQVDYYNWEGESLRKAFLKAPLKFSRISSRYNLKRYHPVLKRYKAHLGTDYAAPKGTPILAVGDGEVIKSEFKGGNGNYVKIRHNGTYTTQYLHMSKRAVKVGERVHQGDVIGYVGSTGLATGPHVCFRFWKNGEQVDHLREDFPTADPLTEEEILQFRAANLGVRERLQSIEVPESEAVQL